MYRTASRLANSIAKRLFWRYHLDEARTLIRQLRRELTTTEMLMALPVVFRGKGHYRSLDLKQNMNELLGLVREVEQLELSTVCEIGTLKGGTLFIWCQLARPDATVFSIDLPGGEFGGGYSERSLPLFDAFTKDGQRLECLRGDSHAEETRQDFASRLGERRLDFLFIDGDHTYDGVRQDFEMYAPYVRPGGIVAFHDILPRPELPEIEVWRFWEELKQSHRHREFIEHDKGSRSIGIGLVHID